MFGTFLSVEVPELGSTVRQTVLERVLLDLQGLTNHHNGLKSSDRLHIPFWPPSVVYTKMQHKMGV